ncbi:MAG: hypothetical protein COB73_05195 [Flavobacteriaceae bacterium]|nr:MAG: hypothetical protein COB73_05195 [Flavobacteriaceae bacterium]
MKFRIRTFISILSVLLLIGSCARKGRPTGGEKDEDFPIIITANPAHESINFKAKKIRLYFDEYIKLKDINKQLVISPPMKHEPIITPVGTASDFINIKITDTLKENTTYTFNFGNSIEDNNEGNILERFKYVFSTGDYIDSLQVTGTISDAYNLEVDEEISIQLYEITDSYTDSIIFNERPNYVANTLDSIGFELTNLKAGQYLMIALKDASNNYTFEPKQDKIGYYPTLITLPTDSVFHIKLFKEELPFKFRRATEVKKGHIYFAHEGDPTGIKIDLISDKPTDYKSAIVFEKMMDSVSYWHTPIQADSLLFRVSHNDLIDTLTVKLRSKEIDSLMVNNMTNAILSLRDTFAIASNIPIEKINKSQIKILDKDSLPVNFTTHLASSKKVLKLDFYKEYNQKYQLQFLPNALEDLFGNVNDTLSYTASTKTPDAYGSIYLTIKNVESYPYILELLDKKEELVYREYVEDKTYFKLENLSPNEYMIRVIYDTNKNKKWDTGNFLKRIKPEKVLYRKSIIELRANWELNDVFFDLNNAR